MRRSFLNLVTFTFLAVVFSAATTIQAQVRAYRVTDRQVQTLINRIETRSDVFRRQLSTALDRSTLNGTSSEDAINSYIADFENATDNLRRRFDARQSTTSDVQEILTRANAIEGFLRQNNLNANVQRQWILVRNDLNLLGNYYNVRGWTWTGTMPSNTNMGGGMTNSNSVYISTDAQLQSLLRNIETRTDVYLREVNRSLDRTSINGTRGEDSIVRYITDFENATDRLRRNVEARNTVTGDAEEVLSRARAIDSFMRMNRLSAGAESQWNLLRNDLNTLAGYYRVSWNWDATTGGSTVGSNNTVPYRVSDTNVQNLLRRIETATDVYRRDLDAALSRSIMTNTRSQESIVGYVNEFERATDNLKRNFDSRRSASGDVEEVLNRAYFIDTFMRDYRLPANVESAWSLIRTDLNTLAGYYNVSWNWNRQNVPTNRIDSMLTGTYRLNVSQSDDVRQVVDRAVNSFYVNDRQRDRLRQNLERRLTSPEMIVIDKNNNQVTLASSLSQQVVFEADGRVRTERNTNGRDVRISANTTYEGVSLSYEGDQTNDFYVNFVPLSNGQLRVVRRFNLENRNETVTVASVYDKIDQRADFSRVNSNMTTAQSNQPSNQPYSVNNDFVIPNGTPIVAVLTNGFSTQNVNENDRFTMEVRSPGQYEGAIIEGYLSNTQRSGRVTGRAQATFNFDTIRLRNGQTYRFSGLIDQVRQPNGETVGINNEGAVRDNNQTTRTVTRAGIGAAIGAIIGAIAGGGQGAAIGAGIGAGAGAGTVILQGRDNLELQNGAEFRITASAPANLR